KSKLAVPGLKWQGGCCWRGNGKCQGEPAWRQGLASSGKGPGHSAVSSGSAGCRVAVAATPLHRLPPPQPSASSPRLQHANASATPSSRTGSGRVADRGRRALRRADPPYDAPHPSPAHRPYSTDGSASAPRPHSRTAAK
ncbi:hypothetical protein E2562_004350, partial [Oryza meyeriana var. granulata]